MLCIRAALDSSDTEDPAFRSGSLVAPLPAHRRELVQAAPGLDIICWKKLFIFFNYKIDGNGVTVYFEDK